MPPRRLRCLRGGVRRGAIGGAVGNAASGAGSGSGSSVAASRVGGCGLLVLLDDVVEGHVESCRHG